MLPCLGCICQCNDQTQCLTKLSLGKLFDDRPGFTWQAVSRLLANPSCGLEEITLWYDVDDVNEEIAMITPGLAANTKLQVLEFIDWTISSADWRLWRSLSNLICNTASIADTMNSNHALNELCLGETVIGPITQKLKLYWR